MTLFTNVAFSFFPLSFILACDLKNINTISWEDSIPLFHELNSLFVIYTEYVKTNNTTKKIYIKKNSKRKTKHKYT